jgi:hypothetical protein
MNEYPPPSDTHNAVEPAEHQPCAVCQRPRCSPKGCRCHDRVCPRCRTDLDEQLAYLAAAPRRLPLALVRGQGGGEKVATSKSAPLPLALDPLSLTAGGRLDDEVRDAFVPHITVWTTVETVQLGTRDEHGQMHPRDHEVLVTHRHRELVPAGDQHGPLPLAVWARAWAADWRDQFGHSAPAERTGTTHPSAAGAPKVGPGWLRTPATRRLLSTYLDAYRSAAVRTLAADVLGLGPAVTAGERDQRGEDHDPLAREWGHRYAEPSSDPAFALDIGYLRTWLGHACDQHPDIGHFAAALRALTTAVRHTLGDRDDRVYLGRCPTGYRLPDGTLAGRELHDRDTGEPVVCGAALWHEPTASVIVCPRCHHEYGEREHLRLAGWIWRAWPIDRRRRYTLDQANDIQQASLGGATELRMPRCEHGRPVAVTWRDATEPGDFDLLGGRKVARRMRRIAAVGCPAVCEVGAGESALEAS